MNSLGGILAGIRQRGDTFKQEWQLISKSSTVFQLAFHRQFFPDGFNHQSNGNFRKHDFFFPQGLFGFFKWNRTILHSLASPAIFGAYIIIG